MGDDTKQTKETRKALALWGLHIQQDFCGPHIPAFDAFRKAVLDPSEGQKGEKARQWRDKVASGWPAPTFEESLGLFQADLSIALLRFGGIQVVLTSTTASEIKAKPIDWLHPGYLAKGMYHNLSAPKGTGKTKISDCWTASATTGRAWPDGQENVHPPAVVLRFNTEDPAPEVLVPGLVAAGADLSKVEIMGPATADGKPVPVDFSSPAVIRALKDKIRETKAVLVIIEPLSNYKGGKNNSLNSSDDMRPIHMALAEVAAETGACIKSVGHVNKKKDVSALEKTLGTMAGVEVGRINLYLQKNPENDAERMLTDAGSNLPVGPALVFAIEPAEPFQLDGHEFKNVGRARFLRTEKVTGDELLELSLESKSQGKAIEAFLREELDGKDWVATDKIRAAALTENHTWTWDAVRQAFQRRFRNKKLGESKGSGKETKWRLLGQKPGPLPFEKEQEIPF
jgi:hypothetical protein